MILQTTPNLRAGGDIRPLRYVTHSTSADHTAVETNADEYPVGITDRSSRGAFSANHAESGDLIRLQNGKLQYVTAGAAISPGARLQPDNEGRAVTYSAGDVSTGVAIEEANALGDVILTYFQPQAAT